LRFGRQPIQYQTCKTFILTDIAIIGAIDITTDRATTARIIMGHALIIIMVHATIARIPTIGTDTIITKVPLMSTGKIAIDTIDIDLKEMKMGDLNDAEQARKLELTWVNARANQE